MKAVILLAALLLSSSIAQGELFDLFSKTDIVPCGAIKTVDNHSPGNSSMRIRISSYYFNGTSGDEMMICFNETLIQDKFNHTFSIGEDLIFFLYTSSGDYYLVTNSSQPPFLENTKDNMIVTANLVIEYFHPPVNGGPAVVPSDLGRGYSNRECFRYLLIMICVTVILISYIYLKKWR